MKEFNYLVEKKRMAASFCPENEKKGCEFAECKECPLSSGNNGTIYSCEWYEAEHPVEATEIVRKWAEEHPEKTLEDILIEKFPKAHLMGKEEYPVTCALHLGLVDTCKGECESCWHQQANE